MWEIGESRDQRDPRVLRDPRDKEHPRDIEHPRDKTNLEIKKIIEIMESLGIKRMCCIRSGYLSGSDIDKNLDFYNFQIFLTIKRSSTFITGWMNVERI